VVAERHRERSHPITALRAASPIRSEEVDEMPSKDSLKEELIHNDDEFRRLHEEHQDCERRLSELNQKSLLSQQDEIEEKQIKRHKLALKDRMAELLRHRQETRLTA
jgi:uncharacterized protein